MSETSKVIVRSNTLQVGDRSFRCAIGRSGFGTNKQEGDGTTPLGSFLLRRIFYRADRIERPESRLPVHSISKNDGWCDDSNDPMYNQHVHLPYNGRHEDLWRDDHLYDLIVVVGYNDNPVEAGKGSAIFMHIASEDYGPTEGCVALSKEDLLSVLAHLTPESMLVIEGN